MLKTEDYLRIRHLHHEGLQISKISQMTGFNRKTIRKYIAAQTAPVPKKRRQQSSKLDPFKEYIRQRINEYPMTAAQICREIKDKGYRGKYTLVKDYIRTIRHR